MATALTFSIASGQTEAESEVKRFSNSLIKRFESLPDKNAFELWRESRDPIIAGVGMIDSAVKNERLDFLNRVFVERGDSFYLIDAVAKLPASDKRDKLTIMMLRSESQFWPDENAQPIYNGSRPGVTANSVEPFVGVIGKYFPALPIDEELFSKRSNRLKLAADLESAMAREDIKNGTHTERPKRRNPPAIPDSSISANRSSDTESHGPSKYSNLTDQSRNLPLMLGAIFLFAFGVFWVFVKKFALGARRK